MFFLGRVSLDVYLGEYALIVFHEFFFLTRLTMRPFYSIMPNKHSPLHVYNITTKNDAFLPFSPLPHP